MAIFNTNKAPATESVDGFQLEECPGVMPTMESSDQFVYEFNSDIAKIIEATYICDIMIENAIATESSTNPEVMLEGVIGDLFDKIKQALLTLWANVKSWFASVKTYLVAMFADSEKFVKKYEKEIKLRASKVKSFKYTGYDYKIADAEKVIDSIIDNATELSASKISGFEGKTVEDYKSHFGKVAELDNSTFVAEFCKKNGNASNISDLKKRVMFTARGSSDKPEELTPSANDFNTMIAFISGYKSVISKIDSAKAETDKAFNTIIRGYDNLKKSVEKNKIPGITGVINTMISNTKTCLSIIQNMNNCRQQIYKEAQNNYMKAIRSLLVYNLKKNEAAGDAAEDDDEDEPDEDADDESDKDAEGGILESALKFL